ncbi:ABC transporter [Paenibacillus sp. FSL P4-0081]|uniref:ABC transporter ATP-binding protein n=1 Tax=unclassified Paenibacillus TaxID=185978 RepID=UPI0004F85889|nr:ABC transporter ATP-binding protein [Paenibacillus sp. FSL P4-0081]AIQ31566.1 ABC transporter [Paenibacillus sp. FSL P4-0081]
MNAIEVKNISKTYKDFKLGELTLEIPQGSVFGLIGENGAGKSTFIKSILGITNSDYDELKYFGRDFQSNEKSIKEEIAVIFDQTHYDLEFTPTIIGKIMRKMYKRWDMLKFSEYLQQFNLPEHKKLKAFSRGMNMKLEFAIAFSHHTKFIILDEATSGLDPIFRDEILDILRKYSEAEEHTILMSSHITSDLDKIADYIGFIHQGKLLFVKSYEDIRENYGIVKCGKNMMDALHEGDIVSYRKESYVYNILVNNKHSIRERFQDLVVENASLEDVMLFMVKGDKVQ